MVGEPVVGLHIIYIYYLRGVGGRTFVVHVGFGLVGLSADSGCVTTPFFDFEGEG